MLFDSDIIIWGFRDNLKAQKAITSDPEISISAVTYIEVIHGLKNKEHLQKWKSLISKLNIQVLPINETISQKAMFWSQEFTLSHGLELADCLIAATADAHGLTLYTGNNKDYRYIPGLILKIFKE